MTIRIEFNRIFKPVFTTSSRYIDIWGGRARGGSHFGTDYFLFKITQPHYFRGCFLRAVFGDIRGSLWQDFKDRVEKATEIGELREDDFAFNESLMTVTYKPTGNTIISKGFKKSSGSQSAKLKSLAGITNVLIEECEEVNEEDFNKLDDSLRTDKVENIQVIRLFNPPHKNHWLMKRFYNLVPSGVKEWYRAVPKSIEGFISIHTTYKDNSKNLNSTTKRKYKEYGNKDGAGYDEDFYYRDVCGLVSEGKKGRIFTKCFPITFEEFKKLPFPSFYGLDFGYSSDPTALVEMKSHNKRLYRHQVLYEPGLTDDDLVVRFGQVGVKKNIRIWADESDPKAIKTLCRAGYLCVPAKKGKGSILSGVKHVQSYRVFTTETSDKLKSEEEEYVWALDSLKNPTDTPIDDHNHGWDATRYGCVSNDTSDTVKVAKDDADQLDNDDLAWIESEL